jgi:hypothetical protein
VRRKACRAAQGTTLARPPPPHALTALLLCLLCRIAAGPSTSYAAYPEGPTAFELTRAAMAAQLALGDFVSRQVAMSDNHVEMGGVHSW